MTLPRVRPAAPADLFAVHALVPGLLDGQVPLQHLWVAESAQRIVGVAGLSSRMVRAQPPAARADLWVMPAWRRQGLGRRLFEAVRHAAWRSRVPAVHTWSSLVDPGARAFVQALGGRCTATLVLYEVADAARGVLARWAEREPPTGLRPMCEGDAFRTSQLHAQQTGEPLALLQQEHLLRLRDPRGGPMCHAIERDGVIEAFVLLRWDGVRASVDYWWRAPGTGAGAAIALLAAASRVTWQHGPCAVRFVANTQSAAAMHAARLMQAQEVRRETCHVIETHACGGHGG